MPRLHRFGRGSGIRKVTVPDLSSLTKTQAESLLSSIGLTYSSTATTTSNSGLDNTIISQNISAGTTVLIGSSISISYYLYQATPPVTPPVVPPVVPPIVPPIVPPPPPPSFTTLPYISGTTTDSLTFSWAGANYNSWKLYRAGTGEVFASGDGQGTSATRSGLSPSTTYTQTVVLYSSTGLTGQQVSDAITGTTAALPSPVSPPVSPPVTPPIFPSGGPATPVSPPVVPPVKPPVTPPIFPSGPAKPFKV